MLVWRSQLLGIYWFLLFATDGPVQLSTRCLLLLGVSARYAPECAVYHTPVAVTRWLVP